MAQARSRRNWVTAEDLLALPDDGQQRELVAGEVSEMAPAGGGHGRLTLRAMLPLAQWVATHHLGETFGAETGFLLARNPDTVRAPDGAFVAAARVPDPEPAGYWPLAPDLVLEVVSPTDRRGAVLAKVGAWLDAGVQVVWVVWPEERRISVYRSGSDITVLCDGDTLVCPALLPGFAAEVTDLLG